ncbi:hypothetical protein MQE22_06955 [Acidithiobacillus sp. YTS05]|nr:hypothetical protein MQE22_06955 [Acidithiobacillus sp. YTS05]
MPDFTTSKGFAMPNIRVRNTRTQRLVWSTQVKSAGVEFLPNQEVDIDANLFNSLRIANAHYGSCGLEWNEGELQASLKEFKALCVAEFESLGIPAVKASVASGELARGDKHEYALEWLQGKSEARELETKRWAKYKTIAAIIAAVATIASIVEHFL